MIPLLILGLLKEKPASYGYELLSDMEANYFQYFVKFTKGSFYYNLQQLGDKEFERRFVQYGSKNEPITFPFYTPMLFVDQVSTEEMEQLLKKQIQQTQEKIHLIELALTSPDQLRPNFVKMMENSKRHHEVNLEWFQEQLTDYKQ